MNEPSLADEEFLHAFLDARLAPAAFDHRGHVRAAWLILHHHSLEDAIELICAGISRLANQFGAPGKYNRTMSESLVRLMASCDRNMSWEQFTHAHPQLMTDVRALLARHYSSERLHSTKAKQQFVIPDRLPLPSCPKRILER